MTTKIRYFKGFWTRDDAMKHPDWLFIFGDNNLKEGFGGQAIIRGLPNALGIPTKKDPGNDITSFYNDNELESNKIKISQSIKYETTSQSLHE